MNQLRVIGIGSPFGDDKLGLEVIQCLQQSPLLKPFTKDQLQLTSCDRPGLVLLELMREASAVFLIDAVKTGGKCGELHRFSNQEIDTLNTPLSSHDLGVAYAVKLGRALNQLPETLILYGIEIDDIQYHTHLSKTIRKAVKKLSKQIIDDILHRLNTVF